MSECKYEIGLIYKAAFSKAMYPKEVENQKKETALMLEFYSDYVGTWFDAAENISFSDDIIEDEKMAKIANWELLITELPNILSQKMTFSVPVLDYLSKEITLGDLKKSVQSVIDKKGDEASSNIHYINRRLNETLDEQGFSKDTKLSFEHYALVRFDAPFADNVKYITPLNQVLGRAIEKARAEIAEQSERDLETEHRQQICSTHSRPVPLQRRPKP